MLPLIWHYSGNNKHNVIFIIGLKTTQSISEPQFLIQPSLIRHDRIQTSLKRFPDKIAALWPNKREFNAHGVLADYHETTPR